MRDRKEIEQRLEHIEFVLRGLARAVITEQRELDAVLIRLDEPMSELSATKVTAA